LHLNKVLIANRGEIACRIIRACIEAGIETVTIYAKNDANSLFVELADQAVLLEGESIAETYLNQEAIIKAALDTGSQAIHPGFGFLSERADFAQAVRNNDLIWIGPSPHAMLTMGDKMTARITMRAAGVPVIPGEEIKQENEEAALEAIQEASEIVGFPLLLKATAGGGGKGMRIVESPEELMDSAQSAMREAAHSFGDSRVFVEKLLKSSRHVEIQILADSHGRTIHLGERECSIQRRHQKVFEESPSPVLDENLRQAMGESAIDAAKAVDFVGAGTVEFLLTDSGEFYFLEMNTRIQVEHPVTEMVTGVDIVREQLRIAAGEPMSCGELRMNGHAIEVRLYAEDVPSGFLPAIGPLSVFRPPTGPGVRLDTGVREGDEITPEYDPMIAKLIVWAPNRTEALQKLRRALDEFVVLGCITNIAFLRDLCDHPRVISGETKTDMISIEWPNGWKAPTDLDEEMLAIAAFSESRGIHRQLAIAEGVTQVPSVFAQVSRRFP